MKTKKCLIICATDDFQIDDQEEYDYIIACDGGYKNAVKMNLMPDIIVGDFDSLESVPENISIVRVPCEKDDTDSSLAVKIAFEKGFRNITLTGALGGRLDHQLANLQLSADIAARGGVCIIRSKKERLFTMHGKSSVKIDSFGKYVSLIAHSERVTGVTLEGFKYPLDNAVLTNTFALGVSNELVGSSGRISIESGTLWVILQK